MTDAVFAVGFVGDAVIAGRVIGGTPSTLLVEPFRGGIQRRVERWRALLFDDRRSAEKYVEGLACAR